jgi:cytochrome d ubiquinol oxidase subunit I
MFGLDAFHLARIQFAFTVSFHIIFPAITIGLASYLAVLEGLWLKTKNPVWRSLYHFWSKIFAVNFGMGVVSGLVMAYQFGTNWSGFSQFAGSITGPLLTYEVLTAFFLEAGFPRRDAVRLEQSRAGAALLFHLHGGAGDDHLHLLDPLLEQLDADPAGL